MPIFFFIWLSLKFMIRKCQLLYLRVDPGALQVTLHNEPLMPPVLHCKSHMAVPPAPEASGLSRKLLHCILRQHHLLPLPSALLPGVHRFL